MSLAGRNSPILNETSKQKEEKEGEEWEEEGGEKGLVEGKRESVPLKNLKSSRDVLDNLKATN